MKYKLIYHYFIAQIRYALSCLAIALIDLELLLKRTFNRKINVNIQYIGSEKGKFANNYYFVLQMNS